MFYSGGDTEGLKTLKLTHNGYTISFIWPYYSAESISSVDDEKSISNRHYTIQFILVSVWSSEHSFPVER